MLQEQTCNQCGERKSVWSFSPTSKTCKVCRRINRHGQRAIKLGYSGVFTAIEWREVCHKHNYRCVKCLKIVDFELMTIDHIVSMLHGGTNTIDNIQPMCARCNSGKRDR
jgi:5-methylcytosine-specific restriction endonuclease McrA